MRVKDDKIFVGDIVSFVMTEGCIILYFVQHRCLLDILYSIYTCSSLLFYRINLLSPVIISMHVLLCSVSLPNQYEFVIVYHCQLRRQLFISNTINTVHGKCLSNVAMYFTHTQLNPPSQTMGLSPQAFSPTHGSTMLHSLVYIEICINQSNFIRTIFTRRIKLSGVYFNLKHAVITHSIHNLLDR